MCSSDLTMLAQGCRIDVEFWEEGPNGELVAPGISRYTNEVPHGTATVPGENEGVAVHPRPRTQGNPSTLSPPQITWRSL